ncbi:light-harvesting complex-like protein OHP2, chloroplastic [Impatiens glandulifera]|uniref:light-harvesting complex-like protein OHP2, chloroplastic n=1 Tax=Impatiens glandulifera TaxID=253017 RepID=UPI001FB18614|nr:light-harvesting complex-like protein OHP2, chloroplastic [Impatiens glandulifera]
MSVTTSIPSIRFSPSSSSSSSSSSQSSSTLRFSVPKSLIFTIRSSQTDGPIRRPVAPSPLKPPTPPSLTPPTPPSLTPPTPPSSPSPAVAAAVVTEGGKNVITLEFQRQKAKEIQEYFKQKKIEEANQGPFFGFIGKNEISNGRWAMFGFAVGLLTEYATGSDFVEQVKLIVSNLGIVDLE